MTEALLNAIEFCVDVVFTLYLSLLLIRVLLQWAKADFYNPVCQAVIRVTNPLLKPLRRVIPGYAGVDWASIALILLVAVSSQYLLMLLRLWSFPPLGAIAIYAVANILAVTINIYIVSTLIWVVTSWLTPHAINPVLQAIYPLIAPVLSRLQRFVPRAAGLDLSPIAFMLLLSVANILFVMPLKQLAISLIAQG